MNMAVGQTERGRIPGPGAMPQATMKIAVGEQTPWPTANTHTPWPTAYFNIARGNAPGTRPTHQHVWPTAIFNDTTNGDTNG